MPFPLLLWTQSQFSFKEMCLSCLWINIIPALETNREERELFSKKGKLPLAIHKLSLFPFQIWFYSSKNYRTDLITGQFCGSCYYFLKSVFLSFPLPNTLLWRKRDYEAAAVNLHGILLLNPGLCPCVTSLQKKPDMEWERRQITAPAFGWKETNERNHMAQDWLTHDCFWNLDVIPLQPWIFLCLAVNPKTSKTIGWKRFLMAGNRSCGWPKINSW